ncbi:LINE-1 retrotransposable element ORF2 protein, partial [Mucuna pruriens]
MFMEHDELKNMFSNFFNDLYQVGNENFARPIISHFLMLDRQIKHALFRMGSFKASGPDGLHPIFFQSNWGKFVFQCVIIDIKDTITSLIPKVDAPTTVNDYRPISLCNVIYKDITKVIATRLKVGLPSFISPKQCRNKKGKQGWIAIKVDLEKAYTKIRQDFLDTLVDIGLSHT